MLRSRPRNWFKFFDFASRNNFLPSPEHALSTSIRSATTQCMLLVFNNVLGNLLVYFMIIFTQMIFFLAPAIAIFFSDSNCISQFLLPPSQIESSFEYAKCVDFNLKNDSAASLCNLEQTITMSTTYNPPFIYSYQCGSTLLVKYVPVYLLMYGAGGILIPCVQWLMVTVLEHIWRREIKMVTGRKYSVGAAANSVVVDVGAALNEPTQPMVMRISSQHSQHEESFYSNDSEFSNDDFGSDNSESSLDSFEKAKEAFVKMGEIRHQIETAYADIIAFLPKEN